MPWKSDAQRRWGHTPAGKKALGGKAKVAEWDQATSGTAIPERVHKGKFPHNSLSREQRIKRVVDSL
jgi:hypothetical protein